MKNRRKLVYFLLRLSKSIEFQVFVVKLFGFVDKPILWLSIFQLNATHHHMESTSLEVTCRIEQPGHFGNVMLVAETKPILTSFDSEVSLTDQFYVIKQVCLKTPCHHITLWTWTRYRNQIMKFCILKSISVLHTGYIFSTETE